MKKTIKARISAVILSLVLLLTVAVPAFAGNNDITNGTIKVSNVDKQASSVTAYQIVKPIFENASVKGYEAVNDDLKKFFGKDFSKTPSPAMLAATDVSQVKSLNLEKENGTNNWKAEKVETGLYLVKIKTENGNIVYNPILLGVDYKKGSSETTLNLGDAKYGNNGVAKKSEASVKKTASCSNADNGNGKPRENNKGTDLQLGEEVKYEVKITIPSYSEAFKKPVCRIEDTLTKGLTLKQDSILIKSADNEKLDNALYTSEIKDSGFNITLNEVNKLAGQTLSIEYIAYSNEYAQTNFNGENSNTVKYTFSNDPYDSEKKKTIQDKTYHYTFELNGSVGGTIKTSSDFIKTGEDLDKKTSDKTKHGGLKGAKFQLYTDEKCENKFGDEVESDENGLINIKYLDGNRDYYLKETYAPAPYKLSDKVLVVRVETKHNSDGTLKDYSFTFKEADGTKYYGATYKKENNDISIEKETENNHYEFINSKTPHLPTTGGIGTYIFTAIGAALIAFAIIKGSRNKETEA